MKDYPQVCFRLPNEWREKLIALSHVRGQPQWRLIVDSVDSYLRELPRAEQRAIARLMNRRRVDP